MAALGPIQLCDQQRHHLVLILEEASVVQTKRAQVLFKSPFVCLFVSPLSKLGSSDGHYTFCWMSITVGLRKLSTLELQVWEM